MHRCQHSRTTTLRIWPCSSTDCITWNPRDPRRLARVSLIGADAAVVTVTMRWGREQGQDCGVERAPILRSGLLPIYGGTVNACTRTTVNRVKNGQHSR